VRSYLHERGINDHSIKRFRLGATESGRLAIPYCTRSGIWHFKYRTVSGDGSKYVNDEGAEAHLYNASTLLAADECVITEGELDAITFEQAGVPAVGYPGATHWQAKGHAHWPYCFDSCRRVVVVGDGDSVGAEAAERVAKSLRETLPDCDVHTAVLPDGEDANSFAVQRGSLQLLEEVGWV
jgi:DNA primase